MRYNFALRTKHKRLNDQRNFGSKRAGQNTSAGSYRLDPSSYRWSPYSTDSPQIRQRRVRISMSREVRTANALLALQAGGQNLGALNNHQQAPAGAIVSVTNTSAVAGGQLPNNQSPQSGTEQQTLGQASTPTQKPPELVSPNDMSQLIFAMTQLLNQNAQILNAPRESHAQGMTHYNILPDLSHNISNFDGLSGASEARVWLKQLESTVTLHRWTEAVAF